MNNIKGLTPGIRKTLETMLEDTHEESFRNGYSEGFEKGKDFVRSEKKEVSGMKRMYVWEVKNEKGEKENVVTEGVTKMEMLDDYYAIFGRQTVRSAEYVTSAWGR